MIHYINPNTPLTLAKIQEIIDNHMTLALSDEATQRIEKCRAYLNHKMETQKEPIYGVTTGFGSLCNISISKEQLSQLQKNLVMSHACGTRVARCQRRPLPVGQPDAPLHIRHWRSDLQRAPVQRKRSVRRIWLAAH